MTHLRTPNFQSVSSVLPVLWRPGTDCAEALRGCRPLLASQLNLLERMNAVYDLRNVPCVVQIGGLKDIRFWQTFGSDKSEKVVDVVRVRVSQFDRLLRVNGKSLQVSQRHTV